MKYFKNNYEERKFRHNALPIDAEFKSTLKHRYTIILDYITDYLANDNLIYVKDDKLEIRNCENEDRFVNSYGGIRHLYYYDGSVLLVDSDIETKNNYLFFK
ncbi:hypothetical protein XBP1_800002 [Xenorhabdus bovienii str. puntauvense]|uniref:Uncharacterized protein n=1 Tax=Xenorhabdus bovienii str. puntauvense TaxID=1398201 RepID=A0A077NL45_XENBV|nr:hypothetical protein XBP1_800002 [Xenorhabdus bovienii str. puntauvense]